MTQDQFIYFVYGCCVGGSVFLVADFLLAVMKEHFYPYKRAYYCDNEGHISTIMVNTKTGEKYINGTKVENSELLIHSTKSN